MDDFPTMAADAKSLPSWTLDAVVSAFIQQHAEASCAHLMAAFQHQLSTRQQRTSTNNKATSSGHKRNRGAFTDESDVMNLLQASIAGLMDVLPANERWLLADTPTVHPPAGATTQPRYQVLEDTLGRPEHAAVWEAALRAFVCGKSTAIANTVMQRAQFHVSARMLFVTYLHIRPLLLAHVKGEHKGRRLKEFGFCDLPNDARHTPTPCWPFTPEGANLLMDTTEEFQASVRALLPSLANALLQPAVDFHELTGGVPVPQHLALAAAVHGVLAVYQPAMIAPGTKYVLQLGPRVTPPVEAAPPQFFDKSGLPPPPPEKTAGAPPAWELWDTVWQLARTCIARDSFMDKMASNRGTITQRAHDTSDWYEAFRLFMLHVQKVLLFAVLVRRTEATRDTNEVHRIGQVMSEWWGEFRSTTSTTCDDMTHVVIVLAHALCDVWGSKRVLMPPRALPDEGDVATASDFVQWLDTTCKMGPIDAKMERVYADVRSGAPLDFAAALRVPSAGVVCAWMWSLMWVSAVQGDATKLPFLRPSQREKWATAIRTLDVDGRCGSFFKDLQQAVHRASTDTERHSVASTDVHQRTQTAGLYVVVMLWLAERPPQHRPPRTSMPAVPPVPPVSAHIVPASTTTVTPAKRRSASSQAAAFEAYATKLAQLPVWNPHASRVTAATSEPATAPTTAPATTIAESGAQAPMPAPIPLPAIASYNSLVSLPGGQAQRTSDTISSRYDVVADGMGVAPAAAGVAAFDMFSVHPSQEPDSEDDTNNFGQR